MRSLFERVAADDRGVTLAELMITVFLIGVLGTVVLSVLSTSLSVTRDLDGSARSNDDIRLILETIDRELRSADRICEPKGGIASNRLEFRTRAFSSSAPPSGLRTIVYELHDLDFDGDPTDLVRSIDAGPFLVIASDVVNVRMATELGTDQYLFENQGANEITSGGTPDASPSFGKVLAIGVWTDFNPNDRIGPQLETTEVAGRNVWTPNAPGC